MVILRLKDDPTFKKLYAYTITRTNPTESFTLVVPKGPIPLGIPLDEKCVGWRAYMEPETNVGSIYPGPYL